MSVSITSQLSNLKGYRGHAEISIDFQLLENLTTQTSEVIAEICGVLIGYLKVQATTMDPVISVSVVYDAHVFYIRQTTRGYLLVKFSRNEDLSDLSNSLSVIIHHR